MSITQAREFIDNNQPEEALALLSPLLNDNQDNVEFLQIFGEVLLEVNELEQAYEILMRSVELDKNGDKGIEKFLYLGQIIGGREGIEFLDVALRQLDSLDVKDDKITQKLNEGIFAKIEIWMTDLCMEPEAESQCDELINYSLKLDNENPETFSLLSSIRISQQKDEEAIEAIKRSWELFQKRMDLSTQEIINVIQPLITLSKYSIELQLYDLSLEILNFINDLNDSILEVCYLIAVSILFKFKLQNNIDPEAEVNPKDLEDDTLQELKSILTNGFKIIQTQQDLDQELSVAVSQLIDQFGGPVMSELMPEKISQEDINQVDEIDSDDE
ncbi:assembly chaperone of RPL4 [[Candida] jaroonii]|uniref:Assembly chaperone of RPL4 n=1 Tax=[Candida] jaroonii TaxID=467808 RepID=A0ACA9YC41_9ASCO|nr:assembly chaperone of RPL4 [[Candida] jaroonii]